MKLQIWMILLLCGGALLGAPAQTPILSDRAPQLQAARLATSARYPNADTVLVEDRTTLSYQPSGAYEYQSETAVKILTEKGRQKRSTVTIGYDASYGITRFVSAEIVKPDGTVRAIDLEQQTRETIDSSQMSANIYDPNNKRIVLNVPHLEIGDLLRYAIRGARDKAVVPDTWSDVFLFEDTAPILHAICQVDAPADRPLQRIEIKDPVGETLTYRKSIRPEGGVRHIWEAREVPQLYPEPDMPTPYTVSQRILLSTIPDWQTLSKWYWNLSQPRLETAHEALRAKVDELTAGLNERQAQLEAIFRFVSQEIRYMGITVEDEAPGYEPHDVSLTFDNRYGVCRDKAALLVSMLRLAGFDAYPVLIYVGPLKDPEVPQPWFNHAITAVRHEDGRWQLMDATNENTRDLLPAYLCHRSYLVAHPDGAPLRVSPVISPEKNGLSIQVDGTLGDDNRITAQARLSFNGINDTAYRGRLAQLKLDEREPYFESRLKQALGSARLTKLNIVPADVRDTTVPLAVSLQFEVDNAVVEGPHESMLRVPTLVNHFGLFGALLAPGTGLDRREYPLQTQITCGISEAVRLDLSAGRLRPSVLPHYQTIDTPNVLIRREIGETNGVLTATAELQLRTVEFNPIDYLELKKNLKTAEQNARKRVILEPSAFPREADFATLNEHTLYRIHDSHHVTKIKTVRQKVLTYAGKKALSDLKIAYNSGFQQVALNYARVTAPDGTVHSIDPQKEINRMDASWVSQAPRYPAEKIMVVNLPGVEVGSVIEYQIAASSRDIPLFSTREPFERFNPIVRKTVQVISAPEVDLKIDNRAPYTIRHRAFRQNDEEIVLEWSANNRPMIRKENHLLPDWELAPTLLLSTDTSENYAKALYKKMDNAAKPTPALRTRAQELTQGIKGRVKKMVALRDFVDRTIRRVGPNLSSLPLTAITPAEQTLREGYGNQTDSAILLYALSRAAKLKPRLVLSSDLPENPNLHAPLLDTFQRQPFNATLVAIQDGKQTLYFGDSGRYAVAGTLAHPHHPALDLAAREIEIPEPVLTNRVDTAFELTLSENGDLSAQKTTRFEGTAFEQFHRTFAQFTPEELRREQQRSLSALSQSAQALFPLTPSFSEQTLNLTALLKNYAVVDGDHIYFILPEGLGNLLQIRSDRRVQDFYLPAPLHTSYRYQLVLPEGWHPVLLPQPFRMELPQNGGTISVQTVLDGNRLTIEQRADLRPTAIPVNQYDELLELNNQLTRPAARTLLLKRTPPQSPR